MSIKHILIFFVILHTWQSHSWARTLRVPAEYDDIATAMLFVQSGDTILISSGVYVEALNPPPYEFVVKGEVVIDSQATEFAVIDPSDLAGSDTLRCLSLTGGSLVFEDIVFRNRSVMTAGRPQSDTGGILGDSTVEDLTLRRCILDSLHMGITGLKRLRLDNCRFIGSLGSSAISARPGRIDADSTVFDGATGSLVTTRRGGSFYSCRFVLHGRERLFLGLGDSLIIQDCYFTGTDSLSGQAIWLRPRCGSVMRDCTIENVLAGLAAVVLIQDSCFGQSKGYECGFKFINNSFTNCGSGRDSVQQGGEMINLRCSDGEQGYLALLDSNRIDSTHRINGQASGMYLETGCIVSRTIFGDVQDADEPQIHVWSGAGSDTFLLRNNEFSANYFGVARQNGEVSLVDARENWWGHTSGPYNAQSNPHGQGASVDDGIRFNPWLLTDPDTSGNGDDSSETVSPLPEQLLASSFSLNSYPTPFNAVTTLVITVARAGEYEVKLFDVMGRESTVLYDGYLSGQTQVSVNANWLPSGVYFAALSRATETLAVTKLLLLK